MRWREVRLALHDVVRRDGVQVVQRGANGKVPTCCGAFTICLGLGERKGGAEPDDRTAFTDHALEQAA